MKVCKDCWKVVEELLEEKDKEIAEYKEADKIRHELTKKAWSGEELAVAEKFRDAEIEKYKERVGAMEIEIQQLNSLLKYEHKELKE